MKDPVRYAMIGGGEGAFIGPVHRTAAAIAGNCRLVAGALSSDPERARRSGEAIGLPADRCYADWSCQLVGVTHTSIGYPMVRQARARLSLGRSQGV